MVEIDQRNVLEMVSQYLQELGLHDTRDMLIREVGELYGIGRASFLDPRTATSDELNLYQLIMDGSWDCVLRSVTTHVEPPSILYDLYEHLVLDTRRQCRDRGIDDISKEILDHSIVLMDMRDNDEQRYLDLVAGRIDTPRLDRKQVAISLVSAFRVAERSRLLTLLGYGLQYQIDKGLIGISPKTQRYDLFRSFSLPDVSSEFPGSLYAQLKLGKQSAVECISSPSTSESSIFACGTRDGYIDIYDTATANLAKYQYQLDQRGMYMDSAVMSLAFNRTGDLLATGSMDGYVAIWAYRVGTLIKKYRIHSDGISSLVFDSEDRVYSGGFDSSIKLYGIRSGAQLKDFRGHSSYVNDLQLVDRDGSQILISCSSDGYVKAWNVNTTATIYSIKLSNTVYRVIPYRKFVVAQTGRSLVFLSPSLKPLFESGMPFDISSIVSSSTGKHLAVFSLSGKCNLYQMKQHGVTKDEVLTLHSEPSFALGDGEILAVHLAQSGCLIVSSDAGMLKLIN